jgi:hypothetical protein
MEHPKSPFEDYNVVMDDETIALLKIAENPDLAPVKLGDNTTDKEQDVVRYIRAKGIVKGTKKVPLYIIYDNYLKWTSRKDIKIAGFSKYFNKVFKPKRTDRHKFYELDPAPFDLPADYSMWQDPFIVGKK